MNVAEMLHAQALACPDAVAIVDLTRSPPKSITFGTLDRRASAFLHALRKAGLRPGHAVLLLHPISAELYIALLAVAKGGMLAIFPEPSALLATIERGCAIHPPQALIASPRGRLLAAVSPTLRRISIKVTLRKQRFGPGAWSSDHGEDLGEGIEESGDDHPALLSFTSGTTGDPKPVTRSHGLLLAQHRVLMSNFSRSPGETDLTALPLFVGANLASGATSVILPTSSGKPLGVGPALVVERIRTLPITSITAGPALLELLARYCLHHQMRLPSVRRIFTGGAPVWPRLIDDVQKAAPRAEITIVYGSTEAEPISWIAWHRVRADDLERMHVGEGLLVGEPVPEIRLRIMSDHWGSSVGPYTASEFNAMCLPVANVGEITVRGEHVLASSAGSREDETKVLVGTEVWHRTGDLGYLDDSGRLWLVGRASDVIRDDRGVLYPLAVECAVSRHAWVRRSAVIPQEGRRVLVVELRRSVERSDIQALHETAERSSIDEVRTLKAIPTDRRHNAKVDYRSLTRTLRRRSLLTRRYRYRGEPVPRRPPQARLRDDENRT